MGPVAQDEQSIVDIADQEVARRQEWVDAPRAIGTGHISVRD
jgi:hypothetical protein